MNSLVLGQWEGREGRRSEQRMAPNVNVYYSLVLLVLLLPGY